MSIRGGFMSRMQSREEKFNLSHLSSDAAGFIWAYIRQHWGRLALALSATLAATLIALALPYLVRVAVDELMAQGNLPGLTILSLIYLALVGLRWLAVYWQGYLSSWVGQKIVHAVRQDLFEKIIHQSLRFHEKEQVGQITSRLTHDLNAIAGFISDGAVNLLADLVMVVGIVVIMFFMHWQLTLITLFSFPVALLSMRYLGSRMRKAYWEVQQALADVNTGVEQGLAGMRVVKSLSRESFTMERFEQLSLQNMKANMKTALLFAAVFPTMTITNMLGIALILGFGGTMIATGQMTLGVLMAFLAYVYRLYGPLRELGLVYGAIQAAGASLDRIMAYIGKNEALPEKAQTHQLQGDCRGQLDVEDVCFGYDDENALQKVSFHVEAGSTIAIVGPTGAGKSTLAKLIMRLYDVNAGCIRLDDIDLRDFSVRDLRKWMTMVPQDVFLFADTIYENIRYGSPQAGEEAVILAAKQAQAHSFITKLPNGYQTKVGELGVRLSGGQKQLIAFARAILADPKILILDEATANVDPQTEALIQQAMFGIAQERTTLIIAHRFSTLNRVDRILVLDQGQMVGYDTHQNLMAENEIYQKLYQQYQSWNTHQAK